MSDSGYADPPHMTRRVLVIDSQESNLRFFEARLSANGFEVWLAQNTFQAKLFLENSTLAALPHLIMLDAAIADAQGLALLQTCKHDQRLRHIPVLVIAAALDQDSREQAFRLGADDFLSKPIDSYEMLARVRNLISLGQSQIGQWQHSDEQQGLSKLSKAKRRSADSSALSESGTVLLAGLSDNAKRVGQYLKQAGYQLEQVSSGEALLSKLSEQLRDLIVLDLGVAGMSAMQVCERIKATGSTAHIPVVMLAAAEHDAQRSQGWEAGADDFVSEPVDAFELRARVRSLVRKKQRYDALHQEYHQVLQRSITDALTGAHNRGYFEDILRRELTLSRRSQQPFSVMMLDIDHFKHINDTYSHNIGDKVLVGFVGLLRGQLRAGDVLARYGGEEFCIIMHGTPREGARVVAERICNVLEQRSWQNLGIHHSITVSVGVSSYRDPDDTIFDLMQRTDQALYQAKRKGRNRVVIL